VLLVTEEHGTSKLDKPVAAVTVLAGAELLLAVVDFVRRTANQLGLRGKAAEHLDRAFERVCRNIIDRAFEPDEEGRYDIYVFRRPGQVVIAVEDRGLPFDYAPLQDGSDMVLQDMLH
jgi:anti-sigma regulatory factor (Ser/Thr protein kinase)